MQQPTRFAVVLGSVFALAVAAPVVAVAKNGADDPVGHVRQAHGADDPAGHVRHGRGTADGPSHT